MQNEILLIASLIGIYSSVIIFYKFFGENGLYAFTAIATISANIEVMIVVDAFGMEQTLGNILFASTFLITDILSELYSKKSAKRAVYIGMATSMIFILISQSWLFYQPNDTDFIAPHVQAVFTNTPRLMIVGFVVFTIVQTFDVWIYHLWWEYTSRHTGDKRKLLWLRNNGSTMISQLLNTILFTFGAFFGVYPMSALVQIAISSYVIFIITSIADTPFIYLARKIKRVDGD